MKKILLLSIFFKICSFNLKREYKAFYNNVIELGISKKGASESVQLIEELRKSIIKKNDLNLEILKFTFWKLNCIYDDNLSKDNCIFRKYKSKEGFFEFSKRLISDIFSNSIKERSSNNKLNFEFILTDIRLISTISQNYLKYTI